MFLETKFTKNAERVLIYAKEYASKLGQNVLSSEHLLLGMLKETECFAFKILDSFGIDEEKTYTAVKDLVLPSRDKKTSPVGITPKSREIIKRAYEFSRNCKRNAVGTEYILLAMINGKDNIATLILKQLNVNLEKMEDRILFDISSAGLNSAGKSTPTLDKFSFDLTMLAKAGKLDNTVGREEEIKRTIQILSRRMKNNPCLIGEAGVGKTAIAEAVAKQIADKKIDGEFLNSRILSLNLTSVVAGTKYRGEFEERISKILNEAVSAKNVILFIDEIHTIVGAGSAEGSVDAANILKPMLARGEIRIIGATTDEEYKKYIQKDSALERRFQPVYVKQPSEEETFKILLGLRENYEMFHKVKISDESLKTAVSMSERYIKDRFLPDKAIDLIDESASALKLSENPTLCKIRSLNERIKEEQDMLDIHLKNSDFISASECRRLIFSLKEQLNDLLLKSEKERKTLVLMPDDIAKTVSLWTKIPVSKITDEEGKALLGMESELLNSVIGQNDAVNTVLRAVKRGRVGIKNPERPTGSFIFAGPTGVGKTYLAKCLAKCLFGSKKNMIRIDMSEFMEKHSVSKLIGSPPGYVGHDDGGTLVKSVRKNPYSVVLFDEIEKAHPDVLNILLQILDDGVLTSSEGQSADFKNTVIIMTTNIGASDFANGNTVGFDSKNSYKTDMKKNIRNALKKKLRPEFLNRVDEVLVFDVLDFESISKIAENMLFELKDRLKEQDILIEFDDSVLKMIADVSYDEKNGARPLRKNIQNLIEDKIADMILNGKIKKSLVCKITADESNNIKLMQSALA